MHIYLNDQVFFLLLTKVDSHMYGFHGLRTIILTSFKEYVNPFQKNQLIPLELSVFPYSPLRLDLWQLPYHHAPRLAKAQLPEAKSLSLS